MDTNFIFLVLLLMLAIIIASLLFPFPKVSSLESSPKSATLVYPVSLDASTSLLKEIAFSSSPTLFIFKIINAKYDAKITNTLRSTSINMRIFLFLLLLLCILFLFLFFTIIPLYKIVLFNAYITLWIHSRSHLSYHH